jgi:hypothetical protein
LVACISTTGLQNKRLSGAQWKRLIRKPKKMEGTWKEKNPPRKTPSSQDKGAVGSSGGVKRPHSDSSTPSLEKQQPKNPRNTQVQTGLYKEAATIQSWRDLLGHRHGKLFIRRPCKKKLMTCLN